MDSERYVLACYRYIELNPVRAGMVFHPGDYRWSSHGRNADGRHDPRITPHATYLTLGPTDTERLPAYRCMFDTALAKRDMDDLRLATQQQKTWGSARFQQQIEALANRELAIRPRGRPKAKGKCT